MIEKKLTLRDITQNSEGRIHILLVDRGIEEINERIHKLYPKITTSKDSMLYDGSLFEMPDTWDMRQVASIALLDGGFRLELEANMDRDTMYDFWCTDSDWVPGSNVWRERLTPEQSNMVARWDQINYLYSNETSEPWTQEWREELSPWEAAMVAKWEKSFRDAIIRAWDDIQAKKQKRKIERSKAAQTLLG